ncbi:MAG: histidinol-phosphate transaminase [Clostridiales bacterium]|nr:histidinol-phosphate transaminase [Clostridiales bacterium]
MSKFFSAKYAALTPYVPGEQPKDAQYIKLNTNESPFAPPASVVEAAKTEAGKLHLYSDPESAALTEKAAEVWGVKRSQVLMTNGSDEALNFAFMAFCDEKHPIVFPDITYGFYPVFAELNGIPYEKIPLKKDFSVDYQDYVGIGKNIVIANPNAPTGLALPLWQIEEIVKSNPNNVVIIDEAYVDFGGESCVPLIEKYDNLLVTQTFSKSRSLAGGRLGLAIGCEKLIADLNTLKYSTNPYNVNRMTAAAGFAALCEREWFEKNCAAIQEVRAYTAESLANLGFTVLDSKTNFLFAKSDKIGGKALYEKLKAKGVLVRQFNAPRIADFVRITIGTRAQMDVFLAKTAEILEEEK